MIDSRASGAAWMTIRQQARAAGVLYLLVILLGGFAEVGVRQGLVVAGDAVATASAIHAHEDCSGWVSPPR